MATHVSGFRIRRGGNRIVLTLVEPGNFSCSERAPIRALHRCAGGVGCRRGLGLRQTVARLCSMHPKKCGASGRGHRLLGIAAFCTFVCNFLCLDPTGHRALEHPWPHITLARRRRARGMVACGTDRRGSRLGAIPLGFVRPRKSVSLRSLAAHPRKAFSCPFTGRRTRTPAPGRPRSSARGSRDR